MTKTTALISALVTTLPLVFCAPLSAKNTDWEITPFIGYGVSDDLKTTSGSDTISVSNDANFGLALAWQDTPNGQGMIMLSTVSHDFSDSANNTEQTLDIIYAHFNGVAQFRQHNYVTTVALGAGGAYFNADNGDGFYPSLTAAIGTRYEIEKNLSIVTEIRAIASLTDQDEDFFCQNEVCGTEFDGALWLETNLTVGVAYKF